MSVRLSGIGASPGRARGAARWVEWELPPVAHRTVSPDEVATEVQRFEEARGKAREDIAKLQERTAARIGVIEAKIFESQILMLDDPDLVQGTLAYIQENYLSAERAFEWRLMEIRSQFMKTAHALALDRLADLEDIRHRVLSELLDRPRTYVEDLPGEPAILLFEELTPSIAVRLRPENVRGLATVHGSRTSHSAVLARSLGIPTVVGVGSGLKEVVDGTVLILDGGTGRIVVDPSEAERAAYERAVRRLAAWREQLASEPHVPLRTQDGVRVRFQANLDQPEEAVAAARTGAEGVGLFRSEFLVIGRRSFPDEEEQYRAYREVARAFPNHDVTLRTFDIGGDKFPIFLQLPPEENPYLGWRAIRVCLDLPELFRSQLRAAVRAAADGRIRLLIPFIVSLRELEATQELLEEACRDLGRRERIPLGVMIETPAAVEILDLLAPQVDFFSLGTNDLTQYVVAADRGNPKLAHVYDPLHPALIRLYARILQRAREYDLEVSVCGDLAAEPVGLALLLGLGYRSFSLPSGSIPELRQIVRCVDAGGLAEIASSLDSLPAGEEIRTRLSRYLAAALPEEVAEATGLPAS